MRALRLYAKHVSAFGEYESERAKVIRIRGSRESGRASGDARPSRRDSLPLTKDRRLPTSLLDECKRTRKTPSPSRQYSLFRFSIRPTLDASRLIKYKSISKLARRWLAVCITTIAFYPANVSLEITSFSSFLVVPKYYWQESRIVYSRWSIVGEGII